MNIVRGVTSELHGLLEECWNVLISMVLYMAVSYHMISIMLWMNIVRGMLYIWQ